MIRCEVFELKAWIEGRDLRWSIRTDLPGGTRVIVDISRRYRDTRGDECLWSLWNGAVLLGPMASTDCNCASGVLDIDEGDAHALSRFNELLTPYSSGSANPVNDRLHIHATVGVRQPLRAFGKDNCNLTGDMAENSGGINIVHEVVQLVASIREVFQPIHTEC